MLNSNEIRFRCSSLGHLMTEAKSKTETLSESCKTHLIDVFVSAKYGRKEEAHGKALDKGNAREEDGITLLSLVTKTFYKKNKERLTNDFIQGECDIFLGEKITAASETIDTKLSWSAHTFFRAQKDKLDKMYYWQGQGYMWLTGAKKHTVAYCLVNGTAEAIMNEKRILSYSAGMVDVSGNSSEKHKEACKQIEINHIFDIEHFRNENPFFEFDNDVENWQWDISKEDRVFTFQFDRNEEDIIRLTERIKDAKKHMDAYLFKTELNKMLPEQSFVDEAKKLLSTNA